MKTNAYSQASQCWKWEMEGDWIVEGGREQEVVHWISSFVVQSTLEDGMESRTGARTLLRLSGFPPFSASGASAGYVRAK